MRKKKYRLLYNVGGPKRAKTHGGTVFDNFFTLKDAKYVKKGYEKEHPFYKGKLYIKKL